MQALTEAQRRKQELRVAARDRRARQLQPDETSRAILEKVFALPQYSNARTVMSYVSFRTEVATQPFLERAARDGKRVAVPYCDGDRLEVFRLESFDELAPGTLGILEPRSELRGLPKRMVAPHELDLVIVPGLAFDRECDRIGYGKGYYDRLLHEARPDAALVAVAFECQIFPEVPSLEHDVRVDIVVTEAAIYERMGGRRVQDSGLGVQDPSSGGPQILNPEPRPLNSEL